MFSLLTAVSVRGTSGSTQHKVEYLSEEAAKPLKLCSMHYSTKPSVSKLVVLGNVLITYFTILLITFYGVRSRCSYSMGEV
jgi:hypothetical protein